MKRNLNMIIAIGIGLSIMSGSISPVFAAEITQNNENMLIQTTTDESNFVILDSNIPSGQMDNKKPVITLEDVIKATISNSDKLALKSKQIKMYRNKENIEEYTKEYKEEINQDVDSDIINDFPYDKLEILEDQTQQSKEFLTDQIANDITNKYNDVVLKQIEINKLKSNLEIKNKDFTIMKTKINIGMLTDSQLNDKEIEIKTLQDEIKAKENALNNKVEYLEVLTNINLSEYALNSTTDYKVFKIDGSIDEYLNYKINKYLKYNDEILKLTDKYLDELRDEKIEDIKDIIEDDVEDCPRISSFTTTIIAEDGTSTTKTDTVGYSLALMKYEGQQERIISAYSSYLDGEYSLSESKVKLDDTKKSLKNALKENYSTLLDLENKIIRLKEQIKSNNTKLNYAKAQVDIGTMTENDYKAQVLKSQDLDISLRSMINTYNTLKNTIEKPWILNNN